MSGDLRARVLDATFAEVDENGLRGLTVEAVAGRAGSSRATIYRHFPGGRDELVETTLRREVNRFLDALVAEVSPSDDVVSAVASLVQEAHRLLGEHRVFQRLLEEEAEAIAPPLATVYPMIHEALVAHLTGLLSGLLSGTGPDAIADVAGAADHGARMVLSYVGTSGTWDLTDTRQAEALVSSRVLPGVVTDVTSDAPGH